MKIFYDALGCPKALVDAEKMVHYLHKEGNTLTHDPEDADAIIINTCGFVESAKQESINTILDYTELKTKKPDLKIIVSGCLSQRYKEQLKELIPEIDNMIGVKNPSLINKAINTTFNNKLMDDGEFKDIDTGFSRDLVFSGMNYAYLKISEGCDRTCSFCAIPGIRGKLRSRKIDEIITEAGQLIEKGVKEIILIGEDLCAYGDDLGEEVDLIALLKQLLTLDIPWLRLLYLFPHPIITKVVHLMKQHSNLCSYIDMPLQHASAQILKKMWRPGNDKEYLSLFKEIRDIVPDISIRSAFIVGFPGETDQDIEILAGFLRDARINRVGFFPYSDEEHTAAFNLDKKVSTPKIDERIQYLAGIQQDISASLLESKIGETLLCINDGIMIEEQGDTFHQLRSQQDAPEIDGVILIPGDQLQLEQDDFVTIRITSTRNAHDLMGERIDA